MSMRKTSRSAATSSFPYRHHICKYTQYTYSTQNSNTIHVFIVATGQHPRSGAIRTPLPHQPADENLNSRRKTKEAGQACVPRKKYELPRGAINLSRKKQGRASHSLSVGEPGVCFIFFKRNICLPRHPHNLKARHASRRKRDSCKYKSTQGKP